MDQVPKNFDWVRARSECSLVAVFLQLSEVVDSDVQAIQSRTSSAKFALNKLSDSKFAVQKVWDAAGVPQGESIAFELVKEGIAAKDVRSGERKFLAIPELTVTGDCKLRIKGEPELLELWQVSRKALEALFFGAS